MKGKPLKSMNRLKREKKRAHWNFTRGSLAKCWDKLDGINTRISMFQDLVWNGVQVLFFGKHCKLKPPLQKFNGKKSEKKICQDLKLDPKSSKIINLRI